MKRWALLTIALYALTLLVLSLPVGWFLMEFKHQDASGFDLGPPTAELWQIYREWFWWVFLGLMLVGQALLLRVPVDRATGRPTARRRLGLVLVGGTFFLGLLAASGIIASALALFGDDAVDFLLPAQNPVLRQLLFQVGIPPGQTWVEILAVTGFAIALVMGAWASWAVLFWFHWQADDPSARSERLVRYLLRGSVLELLVAVPCHVIVRHRHDCCAPAGTAFGIMTGLAMMLMCFGPGVFFLFAARARRLRPARPQATPNSP